MTAHPSYVRLLRCIGGKQQQQHIPDDVVAYSYVSVGGDVVGEGKHGEQVEQLVTVTRAQLLTVLFTYKRYLTV